MTKSPCSIRNQRGLLDDALAERPSRCTTGSDSALDRPTPTPAFECKIFACCVVASQSFRSTSKTEHATPRRYNGEDHPPVHQRGHGPFRYSIRNHTGLAFLCRPRVGTADRERAPDRLQTRAERGHDPAELLGGESTAHAVTRLQRWPLPLRATEPAWPRASSSRSRDHELD